jgi:isopentenyl phosphate kinase
MKKYDKTKSMYKITLLKLGGSLITDKTLPYTPKLDILEMLSAQIAEVIQTTPTLRLVLGHGSGSFGHTAARQHSTRAGVSTPEQWHGFSEVWFQAATLNRYVMEALHAAGVPAVAFAPVSAITAIDGQVAQWELTPITSALAAGLVPVVYGDVIFDEVRGGTILSTEDLFEYLAVELGAERILLAGIEEAVYADFPKRKVRVEKITPASFDGIRQGVGASQAEDVTGGMDSKVRQMLKLSQNNPGLTAQIFSGGKAGNLSKVLKGEVIGTLICG